MKTNIINKLSTLIKSSLNEGFDFDNELESDELDSVISKDISSNFNYLKNYDNLKIPIKDIFANIFKCSRSLPFVLSNNYIDVEGIGPVLYTPKFYKDINTFKLDLDKNPSMHDNYTANSILFVSPEGANRKYFLLKDTGWKFYYSRRSDVCQTFPRESQETIHPIIMQLLEMLANKVGVYNVDNFKSANFKDAIAFAISPDNGVVIVDTIVSQKAIQRNEMFTLFIAKYPICWNMIFYTGLQLYNHEY